MLALIDIKTLSSLVALVIYIYDCVHQYINLHLSTYYSVIKHGSNNISTLLILATLKLALNNPRLTNT